MWRRLLVLGMAFAGFPAAADAQPPAAVSPQAAPAAWIQYAKLVQTQFQTRLGGDTEPAKRLRSYLGNLPGGNGIITVKVWVDNDGNVPRVDFAPFLDPQANADLTGLLQGAHLNGTPPAGILLPIRLNLHVAAADAEKP